MRSAPISFSPPHKEGCLPSCAVARLRWDQRGWPHAGDLPAPAPLARRGGTIWTTSQRAQPSALMIWLPHRWGAEQHLNTPVIPSPSPLCKKKSAIIYLQERAPVQPPSWVRKVWNFHGRQVSSPEYPCHGPFAPQGDVVAETHLCSFI